MKAILDSNINRIIVLDEETKKKVIFFILLCDWKLFLCRSYTLFGENGDGRVSLENIWQLRSGYQAQIHSEVTTSRLIAPTRVILTASFNIERCVNLFSSIYLSK